MKPAANIAMRLLKIPFKTRLLDIVMSADVYAKNGFRLAGAPATSAGPPLNTSIQRFRGLHKLNRQRALNACIQTGYDEDVSMDDADICLDRLYDPRYRIICELFWPHFSAPLFNCFKNGHPIASATVLEDLNRQCSGLKGLDAIFATQSRAIIYHNLAIKTELDCLKGAAPWRDEFWRVALQNWAEVLEADLFWKYLGERIQSYNNQTLRPETVYDLRAQLPAFLYEFHDLFAGAQARITGSSGLENHIHLIRDSHLPEIPKRKALKGLVNKLLYTRLQDIIQRLNSELISKQDKMDRRTFQRIFQSIEQQLEESYQSLLQIVGADTFQEMAEFDAICALVMEALEKIDYSTDDHYRSLLYSILTAKRLLRLPVSVGMRRKIEQYIRRDLDYLYKDFLSPGAATDVDPTVCWFYSSEESDPDSSIEMVMFKITNVSGDQYHYQKRKVIIPRSKYAEAMHHGRKPLHKPVDVSDLQKQIEQIQKQCDEQVRGIQAACDRTIKERRASITEEVKQQEERAAQEAEQCRKQIAQVEAKLQRQIAEAESRCQRACAMTEFDHAKQIAQAEFIYNRAFNQFGGLNGAARLELPLATVSAVLSAIGTYHYAAAIAFLDFSRSILLLGAGLLLGIGLGFVIGRIVRTFRLRKPRSALNAAKKAKDRAIKQIHNEHDKKIAELKKQAEEEAKPAKSRLEQLVQQRTMIADSIEKELAKVRAP
ncbi:MAG: hypothetical protein ABH878_03200, partial [bacterium]